MELVQIKKRKSKDGSSLYLEYTTPQKGRVRMSIGLFLSKSNTTKQNEEIMRAAEVIKAKKVVELMNSKMGYITPSPVKLVDFLDEYWKTHNPNWNRGLKSLLVEYKPKITLAEVNTQYILGFLDFCKNIHINQKNGGKLKSGTIRNYYNQLHSIIRYAYQSKLIPENPFALIERRDRPKFRSAEIQWLTMEQLMQLFDMRFKGYREQVKLAFLFCCFTGLRMSDVYELRYEDIISDDGLETYVLRKEIKKTGELLKVPISEMALVTAYVSIDGSEGRLKGLVFDLPKHPSCFNKNLYAIGEAMGLPFRLHSHIARHSFAMNSLEKTGDIKVVQELMGHKNINNTLIYAKLQKKYLVQEVAKLP